MRKEKRRILFGLLTMSLMVAAAWFIIFSFRQYQNKKAVMAHSMNEDGLKNFLGAEEDTGALIEYRGSVYRRNTYVKAILCIGIDKQGNMHTKTDPGEAGQADGIFLVAEDQMRNTVKILMIPRDTMTEIILSDISGNVLGKEMQHITLAFAYGEGGEKSCEYMMKAVSDLLCGLKIDHYMAFDISAISILNDAVGGVPITITDEDLEKADPSFKIGSEVLLNGSQAEHFVRYRDITVTNSALDRTERQKQYIEAYQKKATEAVQKDNQLITNIMENLQNYLLTDMEQGQYLSMIADFLDSEQMLAVENQYTVPGKGIATELYDEFYPDKEKLIELVLNLFYRKEEKQ